MPDDASPVRVFGGDNWNVFELRPQLGIVSADLHQRFVSGNSEGRITGLAAVLSGFVASQGILRYSAITDDMRRHGNEALEKMGAGHLGASTDERDVERRGAACAAGAGPRHRSRARSCSTSLRPVSMSSARHRFMERVRSIARDGTTLILITHHVEEIIPEIGRVILLRSGRIAGDGAKRDMLTEQHLSETFDGRMLVEQNARVISAHGPAEGGHWPREHRVKWGDGGSC